MRIVRLLLWAVTLLVAGAVHATNPEPSYMISDTAQNTAPSLTITRSLVPPPGTGAQETGSVRVAERVGVEVPIDRGDGGLWVDVVINGSVHARMLIDTGSSVVILPEEVADELGLDENHGHPRRLNTIQGSVSGRLVTLDRITLGDATATEVTAVILEDLDAEAIGLLGRSFLEHFTFQIDLDRNVLTLYPRSGRSGATAAGPQEERWEVERRLEALKAEQARAWKEGKASPRYLEYLRRSVDYWAAQQARYN